MANEDIGRRGRSVQLGKITCIGLLIAGIFAAGIGGATACGKGKLIFEDKFAKIDPSWVVSMSSNVSQQPTPEARGLAFTLPPGAAGDLTRSGAESFEVCALVVAHKSALNAKTWGVVAQIFFWRADYDHSYKALAVEDGRYWVNRRDSADHFANITPILADASLWGPDANELDLRIKGNAGSFSVNGKKIGNFTGDPPSGGGKLGISFVTDEKNAATETVYLKDFQLRELDGTQP